MADTHCRYCGTELIDSDCPVCHYNPQAACDHLRAEVERLQEAMLDDIPCDGEPDHNSDECVDCRWVCDGLCLVSAQPAALYEDKESS
jgi:hypothetical protein